MNISEKVGAENPFSALDKALRGGNWAEEVRSVPGQHGQPEQRVKVIQWPQDAIPTLAPVEFRPSATPLTVKVVSQEEIEQGFCFAPEDTWNLANFITTPLRTDGVYIKTLLNLVEGFYTAAKMEIPSLPRNRVCFSKNESLILLLPMEAES